MSIMETASATPRHLFVQTVSVPDSQIDLALASLYIAAEERASLDVVSYLGRIVLLARRVKAKLRRHHSVFDAVWATNEVLFEEEGIRGNRRHYYDPRNSFLPNVLDRKLGIPISVSTLYLEVAKRAGHRFTGVGLPGHFVIRASEGANEIYVDPFDQGGMLTRRECLEIAHKALGSSADADRYLKPLSHRAILRRALTNLKMIYLDLSDLPRALAAAERIQVVEPESWQNLGDLAKIQTELGDFEAAAESLVEYLERAPSSADLDAARNALKTLGSGLDEYTSGTE